jgi:PAS domain S-box-containing protein
MSTPDHDQEKTHLENKLRIQRQIAFVSGLFQTDVTVRTLLESLAEGVVVIDSSGTILLVNTAAEQMFGYLEKELIGEPQAIIIPERFRKVHEVHLAHFFAKPRIRPPNQHLALAGLRRDGSEFPVEISLNYIETINGVLALAFVCDITGRKNTEDALRFSEERYRALFRDNPTMIVTLDADLTMLSVNPVCASQLGYTINELEGQPVLKLFHEEDHPAVIKQLRMCLQNTDQVYRWQFRKIRKDGAPLWVEETAQAVYDLNGALNLLVVCQDVTENKRMVDELKKISMQNELILASAGEGIIGLDLEGNQTFVNASAAAMLGHDINELVGKQSHSTWHYARPDGSDYPMEKCPVYAAYKDGTVYSGEEMFLRKDGTGFPVRFTSRPIFFDEKIVGAVLTFNDISERKRMEEDLRESEERFRATFNQAAVGIGHVTPDGRWLRINQKYCDIVGYTEEEIKNLTIKDITHPDDLETSLRHYQLLLEGKLENYSLEKRYIHKNGSTVWVNLTASMVFDAGGNPIFAVAVVEDISKRRQAEEERDWVYKYSLDMLCVAGFDRYFKRVSPSFEKILGWSEAELLSTSLVEFIHPDEVEATLQEFRNLEEGKQAINFMNRYRCKDGSYKWVSWNAHPVVEKQLIIGVARDITERKRVEEEIKRLNTELAARAIDLEVVNRELEAFNYTVAHDLRKPLTVVNGYCQALQELCADKLDEACTGYLREAYEGTWRMNRLIDTLLNFSRLAHIETHRETVNLSAMAHEVVSELKLAEPERQVEFHIPDGVSANGDSTLLRVVLDNLFGNAWKYTGMREKAVIEFGVNGSEDKPAYFVRDNGAGFNNEHAPNLFIPFQRLHGAEQFKGFGIGLATVERIIRRHGGRVWAEGEPGKGATFYFTLQS